jgi:hypothetical protein
VIASAIAESTAARGSRLSPMGDVYLPSDEVVARLTIAELTDEAVRLLVKRSGLPAHVVRKLLGEATAVAGRRALELVIAANG